MPVTSIDDVRSDIAAQLGIDAAQIDDATDLISLGLDSIRMMKLAGGWRKRGHDVNFAALAEVPTVQAWSGLLGVAAERGAAALTPLPDDGEPFGLAPMQHAYWVGRTDAAGLGRVAAHLYVEFDGTGLDADRLREAAAALADRHPMLRAAFTPDGTQHILPRPGGPVLTVADLRESTQADVDAELTRVREARSHQLLDIENGQVFDLALTLLPDGRHRLHFDIDMLAADAMSYRLLLSELVALYDGAELAPIDVSYRDYLRHRAEHPDPARDEDRRWWAERLAALPGGPVLPAESGAAQSKPARVARMNHWLDADAKERLLAAAHERGVTPAAAVAAVYAATVGAWSANKHFLLNVPLFQRAPVHPGIEGVSGDFSSSLLVDVDVSDPGSVLDLARDVQRRMHAAGAHSSYGALEVLRDLGRERGETVLAPVVFTSALGLGELFADTVYERLGRPDWIVSQGPQVLLDAQITEVDGGLLTNWDVRVSEFPEGVVEAMFAQYTAALDRLAAPGGGGWLAEARPQLPAAQREVRSLVNDTAAPVSGRLLHQEFFARAVREPDADALLWRGGRLTYGELAAQALAVAGAIRGAGVRPGDAVGVQLPKGHRQVIATLGVYASGAVWIPISYDQPTARRDVIVETGDIAMLLTDGAVEPDRVRVPVVELADALSADPLSGPHLGDPEDVAYVLFTSGSTGTPKGVEVPHRAAMNTIDDVNARFEVGHADRSLTVAALEFDISVYDLFGLYSAGGAVVAVEAADAKDPEAWRELLVAHGATVLTCVPSALDMLLTLAESRGPGSLGDSLRAVLLGGDWVGADLPGRLRALSPATRFAGLGGATEIAIHGTVCEVIEPPAHWTSVPFGTPLHNVVCRVVDEAGFDCPDWVTGELWVGGDGVATGYRNDPERTAQRFVSDAGRRWYRTGDLARYWPDGTIEFLGRADHQVKIRGFRVELGEVEGAMRALDGVRHAVAAVTGSGAGRELVAAVAPESGATIDAATVRERLAELLPAYMIPAHVEVFEAMPLTGNGKLDRAAIDAVFAGRTRLGGERAAPSTDLHRALIDLYAQVLDVPAERIGVDDDFFASGGDSVLATALVARVRELLDAPQAGVADVFAARTVAALAERLDAADAEPGRLEDVAGVYLEIAAMDEAELVAAEGAQ